MDVSSIGMLKKKSQWQEKMVKMKGDCCIPTLFASVKVSSDVCVAWYSNGNSWKFSMNKWNCRSLGNDNHEGIGSRTNLRQANRKWCLEENRWEIHIHTQVKMLRHWESNYHMKICRKLS